MGGDVPDPIRSVLLEILRQLNSVEVKHEGQHPEQSLELGELEQRLSDFWAVRQGEVKVRLALGLLLRNRMVSVQTDPDYSWQRQRSVAHRYQISTEGKKFLVEAVATAERIR